MSTQELSTLIPYICLSVFILAQMMQIAFARNLTGTVSISLVAIIATGLTFLTVPALSISTPLILVDGLAKYFSFLILLAALVTTLTGWDYFRHRQSLPEEFFMLLLLAALGALVLVASSHLATFILGLELLGVSIYAMMSYPSKGLFSLEAALKYLILSGVSSAFILFGAALIFAASGSLSFQHFGDVNRPASGAYIYLLAGTPLILAGVMFKLSLAPFHMWTPDVYQGAPSPVTGFVATVSKGAIFAITFKWFLMSGLLEIDAVRTALSTVAILSMILGNVLALRQDDVKRLLAYSSIAQFGYLMVAFIAAGATSNPALSMETASFFLFAYFLTTLGAFGVVTIMSVGHAEDRSELRHYEGLFYQSPAVAWMFTTMLLSLAGIPLTAGFIGKFYIFGAGVDTTLWLLLAGVILGSSIGIFYYLRVIFVMTAKATNPKTEIPIATGIAMLAMTLMLFGFGIYPTPIVDLINNLVVFTS